MELSKIETFYNIKSFYKMENFYILENNWCLILPYYFGGLEKDENSVNNFKNIIKLANFNVVELPKENKTLRETSSFIKNGN